jgi:hypothetical protein
MLYGVIELPMFLAHCERAGLSDDERFAIVLAVAEDPFAGDAIPGTGGARKRRFAARGRGKRGSYRVISFYGGDDVPVLLLALVDKGERADISQAERNALRTRLLKYAPTYRAGQRRGGR